MTGQTTADWLLVPSPFLHAAFWERTAGALRGAAAGDVRVAELDLHAIEDGEFYRRLAEQALRETRAEVPLRVVMHSNAGTLVPSIAAARPGQTAFVFVDAALPTPGRPWLDGAPPPLVDHLRGLVDGGTLAPWPEWFGGRRGHLIPDAELERRLYARCPRTPWSYLEELSPTRWEWMSLPLAYLQLSEAYAAEAEDAEQLGWPVARLALHHLSMVTDPVLVAEALLGLAGQSSWVWPSDQGSGDGRDA